LFVHNILQRAVGERKNVLAPNGLTEIRSLGETCVAEFFGQGVCADTRGLWPRIDLAIQKSCQHIPRGLWHRKSQLKAAPNCSIEQFGMIRCRNGNDVAWQLVNLH
jgi:hypothetical protein